MRYTIQLSVILLVLALALLPAAAQESDKPFAETFVVLQVADGDAKIQSRALSVANNLIKHYGGPDFVDIEIVAYGPGISLLYTDTPNQKRISSLLSNAVRFVSCQNTLDTIERSTGKRPEIIPEAIPVQTGVARIVERAQEGFVVIRP